LNNVEAHIDYNNGEPIVSIRVKDGDQFKVHVFNNIHENLSKDRIAKELQIDNPNMIQKIMEGIGAGLKELDYGYKLSGYNGGSGNKDVNISNENVSLPPTDGLDSRLDLDSNFNSLLIPFCNMDNSILEGILKAYQFILVESEKNNNGKTYKWAEKIPIEETSTVKQTIEKIANKALLIVTHLFETQDPIIADINKGDKVEQHYVFNIGTTEDEFVINNGETNTEGVYRRVLGSSIGNGMPIVIYHTGGDNIENIVGVRMFLSANEKQHIDQLSNYIRNNGNADEYFAKFLNRFKKALTDLTIIGAVAFATNQYYISHNTPVGDIKLENGTIKLESGEALTKAKNHYALIPKHNQSLAKTILSILQVSTKLKNIGNMNRY